MKKLWKIITYPFYLPGILNRKFWLHTSLRIAEVQQSEAAIARAAEASLRARLSETNKRIYLLEQEKKQLQTQLEMEIMDRYVS